MFCTHIDINNLEYKSVSTNKSGGKVVHVSTEKGSSEWKHRVRFQMSETQKENLQTAVWPLSTPMQGQDASRRTLELSIDSPSLKTFLEDLDKTNITQATNRCQDWFKKTIDPLQLEQMYVNLVRPPSKPDAPHTVRIKVKCGDYPTNIYIVQGEVDGEFQYTKGTPDDLKRNVKVMAMVETSGLWFMSRQFGMSLTATELLVWPNHRPTGIESMTLSGDIKKFKQVESVDWMGSEEDTGMVIE